MANATEIRECPDCGSTNIIHGKMREQIICRDCGLIFEPSVPVEVMPAAAPAKKPSKKAKPKKAKPKKKSGALKKLFKKLTKKRR